MTTGERVTVSDPVFGTDRRGQCGTVERIDTGCTDGGDLSVLVAMDSGVSVWFAPIELSIAPTTTTAPRPRRAVL